MEVKIEPSDQSIEKNYSEMCEKYGKLQQNYAGLQKEMVIKSEIFKQQIATELLTKLQGQNQEDLKRQQNQKTMMENSQHTIEVAQCEFAETMMDEIDQMEQQILDNTFVSPENANTIIKRELENAEMVEYSQIPTTSSALNLNNEEGEDEGDERIGLEEFVVEVEGLEKIEWDDEEDESGSPSAEMDLDGEKRNGTRMEENGNYGKIKCAPTKIGNIFYCNWPGCEHQTELSNIRMHWRAHSGERPYVCMECGQSFKQSGALKRHKLIHSGEKPYQCDVCGKSFRQSNGLVVHKLTHTDEMPYICEKCGQSFKQSKTLKNHMRIHTGDSPKNLDNNIDSMGNATHIIVKREHENDEMGTNSSFQFQIPTTSSALNLDNLNGVQQNGLTAKIELDEQSDRSISAAMYLMDEGEARMDENCNDGQIEYAPTKIGNIFKCNWPGCEHQTKRLRDMPFHWRTHTGERPYVCMECGQSFTHPRNLKRHKRIHTDEKPYRCDVCGKSFKQSSKLRKHKRTHTGKRPYICAECGESFKQKWELKNHELLHKKSYKCDQCGKLFWQSITLAGHKQIHTRERPNICPRTNVDNTFVSPENTNNIKRELENDEMGTNSPFQFQMPTTSSALNLNVEDEGNEQQNQDGLEKFVVEVERLEKIEWDYEEESGSPSAVVEMDLDDGEGEGQISLKDKIMQLLQSGKEGDIGGQIKYAPTKIGNILKCNWPGCEYKMKTLGDMLIHWREHTVERPPSSYICVECGKSFKRSNNLKKHLLTHKKPYQCDVCDQSFKHSFSLNEHKRNHTGEKSYLCMVGCGESFKTSNELWKHRQKPCKILVRNYSNICHSGDGKME